MICAGGARAWGSVLGAQVLANVCDERGLGDLSNGPQFAATSCACRLTGRWQTHGSIEPSNSSAWSARWAEAHRSALCSPP